MSRRIFVPAALCLCIFGGATLATAGSCDDAAIMALKGKWTAFPGGRPAGYAQAVHALLLEAYPELVGMQEGRWGWKDARPGGVAAGLLEYDYLAAVTPYFCSPKAAPDSMLGKMGAPFKPVYYPKSSDTNLQVHFNHFGDPDFGFLRQLRGTTAGGLQVFHRLRPAGAWKGRELYVTKPNLDEKDGLVMLSRKGALPYRPVTRKQYLDLMLAAIQRQYDDSVAAAKQIMKDPVASRAPEFMEGAKRTLAEAAKLRDGMSTPFREELKKNAAARSLDAPAVVDGIQRMRFEDGINVFTTEEAGGQALVTANTDYFRKDLPPQTPQFIVVHWSVQPGVAAARFRKLLEGNLQIEKLQAMIDK